MKTASITIYDWDNKATVVSLPNKEIREIFVHVLSGDETGFVEFVDGEKIYFDASSCRLFGFEDGCYTVNGENVKKWIEYKPSSVRTASYERQGMFY